MVKDKRFRFQKTTSSKLSISYESGFFFIWAFYEFFSILFGSELKNTFEVNRLDSFVRYAVIVMLTLLFFLKKRVTAKFFVISVLLLILIFFVELANLNKYFLVYILFILNAKNINFRKFISFDIKVKLVTIFTIVFLCLAGITNNYSALFYNGVRKFSLGFSHPNTFTCFALSILLEWLLLKHKSMNLLEWIFNILLFCIVYYFGRGRSSGYAYCVVYIMFVIARLFPDFYKRKTVRIFISSLPLLMTALSFSGVILFEKGNSLIMKINDLLTGRLYGSYVFLKNYKINLFGQDLALSSSRDISYVQTVHILDNAYVRCLLMYGLIVFIIIIFSYVLLFNNLIKKNQIELALLGLYFIVIGFGESYMIDPIFNVTLLCLINASGSVNFLSEKGDAFVFKGENESANKQYVFE